MKSLKKVAAILGGILFLVSCQVPGNTTNGNDNNSSNNQNQTNSENTTENTNNTPEQKTYTCSIEIVFPDEVTESMELQSKAMAVHYDNESETMVFDYPDISFKVNDEIWDGFDPHYEITVENNIAEIPDTSTNMPTYKKAKVVEVSGNKWVSSSMAIDGTEYVCVSFNSKKDGTGTEYKSGDKVTLTDNTVLYGVKWIKKSDLTNGNNNSGDTGNGTGTGQGVWYKFPGEWSVDTTIVDLYVYFENEQFVKACHVGGTLTKNNPLNPWTYERAQTDAVLVSGDDLPAYCN